MVWPIRTQALRHYSHIVLDEIHERDLDMDRPSRWSYQSCHLLARKWCVFRGKSVQTKSEEAPLATVCIYLSGELLIVVWQSIHIYICHHHGSSFSKGTIGIGSASRTCCVCCWSEVWRRLPTCWTPSHPNIAAHADRWYFWKKNGQRTGRGCTNFWRFRASYSHISHLDQPNLVVKIPIYSHISHIFH